MSHCTVVIWHLAAGTSSQQSSPEDSFYVFGAISEWAAQKSQGTPHFNPTVEGEVPSQWLSSSFPRKALLILPIPSFWTPETSSVHACSRSLSFLSAASCESLCCDYGHSQACHTLAYYLLLLQLLWVGYVSFLLEPEDAEPASRQDHFPSYQGEDREDNMFRNTTPKTSLKKLFSEVIAVWTSLRIKNVLSFS